MAFGDHDDLRSRHERVRTLKAEQGADHPVTLNSQLVLALALHSAGRMADAEREARVVHMARRRLLGDEHHDTSMSRGVLTAALRGLGRWHEAEDQQRATTHAYAQTLGADHHATLASRYNLAVTLHRTSRAEDTAREHRTVAETCTRRLGSPDLTTQERQNLTTVRDAAQRALS